MPPPVLSASTNQTVVTCSPSSALNLNDLKRDYRLAGCGPCYRTLTLGARAIEFAVANPSYKRIPLGRGKREDRTPGILILTIANVDKIARQAGHLDATTIRIA